MSFFTSINKKFKSQNKLYWWIREQYVVWYSRFSRLIDIKEVNKKSRLLFYHIDSLGFAGTEKFLQILARHIDKEKYDVFYLYPSLMGLNDRHKDRLDYINLGGVIGIPFDYKAKQSNPPYFVNGMNPDIKKIIKALNIDLLVVADSGNANYPFSIIKNIPIILLNIFGLPNVQKNIKYHLCISKEVASKLSPIVPNKKIKVYPVPSEGPFENSVELGKKIREGFGIKEDDIVFGRIGRADNGIFDPIGIEAFKLALKVRADIHYIIMSPPPILLKMLDDEKIQNVHILQPSSSEQDVWAFHAAIDALAHFRNDGESFGLNIVESMLSGKPIITHKSNIWNAHLEYLDKSFSRVADKGDIETYKKYITEYANKKKTGELQKMGMLAKEKSGKMFLVKNIINQFENWVVDAVQNSNVK